MKAKPVYMYDVNMNFIRKFETTKDCAAYFRKDAVYINHVLAYGSKIRKHDKWYILRREEYEK